MSAFTESNTVEAYIRDLLAGPIKGVPTHSAQESPASYGPSPKGIGWRYVAPSDVPRQIQEVLVDPWLRDASPTVLMKCSTSCAPSCCRCVRTA
jgi:type I restriction enzyme R subunit